MIQEYFKHAELALAAYANMQVGIPDSDRLQDEASMSDFQAAAFASKWKVVEQYTDPVTGVSATVFQAVSGGQKYLAVRGTDGLDDIVADLNILQAVPMELNLQYVALKAQVETWLENGTLSSGFTVTGHSLGGYLATGLVADFGDDIAHAYLYNAPGINGLVGDITASILGIFGLTAPVDPAKISNIKADAGSSPIAGLGEQVAPTIQITIEDQSFSDVPEPQLSFNHSQRVLTDSLALYAAYSNVDPTITVENITKIIKASSNLNVNTLEKALDNLRELLLGATIPGTVPEGRESYYTNLNELSEWLNARLSSGDAPVLRLDPLIGSSSFACGKLG
jgi:pimeloyl-ACP methyl ester carboxylesterase